MQAQNKPLFKKSTGSSKTDELQKSKLKIYKSSPNKNYSNYEESSFNIRLSNSNNRTYEIINKSKRKIKKKFAKKNSVAMAFDQYTFDDRNRRLEYKQLFEEWKRSKSPENLNSGMNKDTFFKQSANCKFCNLSLNLVTDYKAENDLKSMQSGDQK